MFVEVGFSEKPDSREAGHMAATDALQRAKRPDPCTLVLLFATSRHDAEALRNGVVDIVGKAVPIVGGGAVGVITNEVFGYAGDQVALALIWQDDTRCDYFIESSLNVNEEAAGERLGRQLAAWGVSPASPVALFYDAIDRSRGDARLVTAMSLLQGIHQGLGFWPALVGGGFQGDYLPSATRQWTGEGLGQHTAVALAFSENVRMDHVIMHGCRPGTSYYTVTKAEGQTILEIDGVPALDFMDTLLQGSIPIDNYPFFLIFGVNRGEKWGEFSEESYVNRLCLAIDKPRKGLVMFEPDMVTGTEFQVMYRCVNYDYMIPRIHTLFDGLEGRKPVFSLYIDCAGRAAGYGGHEREDAVMVQRAVAGRVPLLGLYSGVEIAPVEGRPRGLDWTGVFCLFSVAE